MALVDGEKIKKLAKDRNSVHKEVDATYSVFHSRGKKYLQIDTYGSNDRQYRGKVSQSIQLNRSSAEELVKLLKFEFNL